MQWTVLSLCSLCLLTRVNICQPLKHYIIQLSMYNQLELTPLPDFTTSESTEPQGLDQALFWDDGFQSCPSASNLVFALCSLLSESHLPASSSRVFPFRHPILHWTSPFLVWPAITHHPVVTSQSPKRSTHHSSCWQPPLPRSQYPRYPRVPLEARPLDIAHS